VGVVAIFGPTASGKSAVAEALAERIPAELVSADAMQAYRGLPILTNQSAAPARLVRIWPLDHEGSVGEYAALAHAAIDEILAAGRTPVVVGGTGLYLRAALADLELPAPSADRARWDAFYDEQGGEVAHARLAELDPAAAALVHPNDRRRVVRALELTATGESLAPAEDRLWSDATRHPTLVVGLEVPKAELERRIEARTRAMFEAGVAEEARRALAGPLSETARKTLGLEEAATLPPEEARAAIVTRTRRYAAYQRKWMRRIPELIHLDGEQDHATLANEILVTLRERITFWRQQERSASGIRKGEADRTGHAV
jgi:tRNA dimethylallyltransferase